MSPELEKHLKEMGVIAASPLEELDTVADFRLEVLAKGYFNDPRDGNGEVPY